MALGEQAGWELGLTLSLCTLGALPHLQAKSQFKLRSTANVEIHIPVPNDADHPSSRRQWGAKWVPENSEIV